GVVDGRFPGRTRPHALFPEEDRLHVNRLAKRDVFRLATGESDGRLPFRLAEDRLLLHAGLTAATKSASLTFARRGFGGEEQLPSAFLDELHRAAGSKIEPMPVAPVAELDRVDGEGELRERVA